MQTQERDLRATQEQAARSNAEALRVQEELQEAERRLMVLAEDDQDLCDKVPHVKLPACIAHLICKSDDMQGIIAGYML